MKTDVASPRDAGQLVEIVDDYGPLSRPSVSKAWPRSRSSLSGAGRAYENALQDFMGFTGICPPAPRQTTPFTAPQRAQRRNDGEVQARHRHREFLSFLGDVDTAVPVDYDLHCVGDNGPSVQMAQWSEHVDAWTQVALVERR